MISGRNGKRVAKEPNHPEPCMAINRDVTLYDLEIEEGDRKYHEMKEGGWLPR